MTFHDAGLNALAFFKKLFALECLTNDSRLILKSPLPGVIVSINVKNGDIIEKDSNVLVIESMKMQNIISAPNKLKVKKIYINEKDIVHVDQILLEFESAEENIIKE